MESRPSYAFTLSLNVAIVSLSMLWLQCMLLACCTTQMQSPSSTPDLQVLKHHAISGVQFVMVSFDTGYAVAHVIKGSHQGNSDARQCPELCQQCFAPCPSQ